MSPLPSLDYPDDLLRAVLGSVRSVAVVGVSANPARPSHAVMAFLQRHGYRCVPVNPGLAGQTLLGETVGADLRALSEPVDMVDVFRNSAAAGAVVDAAVAIGAKVAWLQLGVRDDEAAARAEAAGLRVVMDRCPKIEMLRLGLAGPAV